MLCNIGVPIREKVNLDFSCLAGKERAALCFAWRGMSLLLVFLSPRKLKEIHNDRNISISSVWKIS